MKKSRLLEFMIFSFVISTSTYCTARVLDTSETAPYCHQKYMKNVDLIAFTAEMIAGRVTLQWASAAEVNNKLFVVQRSYDSILFHDIGIIEGAKNSVTLRNYQYQDTLQKDTPVFYRLKQVDVSGKIDYSNCIIPKKLVPEVSIQKPIIDRLCISFREEQKTVVIVSIYDSQYKEIFEKEYFFVKKNVEVPIGHMQPDTYLLVLCGNKKILHTEKIIIQKN